MKMGGLAMNEIPHISPDQDPAVKDFKRIDHFAALAEISDDFICLANAHGEPFYLNPAAKRILGLPEGKSAADTKLHDYYAADSWAQIRDVAVPAVNKTGVWRGATACETSPQTIRGNANHTHPRSLARACRSQHAGDHPPRDRRAGDLERPWPKPKPANMPILESSLDPIITINHEGMITEFNRAAEQTFGHPRDKILGTKPSDVLFPPAMDAGQQDRIDRYLNAGEGSMLGKRVEVDRRPRKRRNLRRRNGHDHQPRARRAGADVSSSATSAAGRRPSRSKPATRPNWSDRTANWSSSPTSLRTICRSRCGRFAPSATACK